MNRSSFLRAASLVAVAGLLAAAAPMVLDDPEPAVVTPCPPTEASPPPSDAIVLFDGSNLDNFTTVDGKPSTWTVADKIATIAGKGGSIVSKRLFNDAQIHVEFATPAEPHGDSQERGNSGIYVQGRYEVQVLDSFKNKTYPNGQCGAIYGQHPPLVNACRAPGVWQTYDIIFHAAKFNDKGEKTANARFTVLHNGVLVQDNAEATGPTGSSLSKEGANPGPLYLQDHGNAVRYRNIWIRPLNVPVDNNK